MRISKPRDGGTSVRDGIGVSGTAWSYPAAIAVWAGRDCSIRLVRVHLAFLLRTDLLVVPVVGEGDGWCLSLRWGLEGSGRRMRTSDG